MQRAIETLLVITHVRHYAHAGRLYAYGPYAREIDIWASLFPKVRIASPFKAGPPSSDSLPFESTNISILPQLETGGNSIAKKLLQIALLPRLCWDLIQAMRKADAVHVRCPGNLGLLGTLLAPIFSRYMVTKYSNQWSSFPGEPLSWKLQRFLLGSRWWRGPVTVYSRQSKSRNVVPFFTSIMTAEQIARARRASACLNSLDRLRLLYIGRLTPSKNVDTLLAAAATLKAGGAALECKIVGEGPQREQLEQLCEEYGLEGAVEFTGGLPFDGVLDHLERANVLVLVSETEGWPKAIAEGMAFGLICIGTNRGLVPDLLGEGRGITVPPGNSVALADALRKIAANPAAYDSMRQKAAAWGQQFSLESVRQGLSDLLEQHWNVRLEPARTDSSESSALSPVGSGSVSGAY